MKDISIEEYEDCLTRYYVRFSGSFTFVGKQSARRFIDAVEEIYDAIDAGKNVEVKRS